MCKHMRNPDNLVIIGIRVRSPSLQQEYDQKPVCYIKSFAAMSPTM